MEIVINCSNREKISREHSSSHLDPYPYQQSSKVFNVVEEIPSGRKGKKKYSRSQKN